MAEINYEEILKQMTLEEKASLLSGLTFWKTKPIERLGVPSVWMSDGPNGLRKEKESAGTNIMQKAETATCFPTSATVASSLDVNLAEEVGNAIADEAHALGVTTVLGPGVNIKRSPLCGRNFEYFSEDPFLAGRMGAGIVRGIQKNGIGTSLKHYAGNNQETLRMCISSVIDERALREIYLSQFEYIVKKEQPTTIMSSYNRLNGTYLTDNKRMLTDILRKEWGFKGIVVSDWGAMNDRVESVKAGNDLEMPGNKGMNDAKIVEAVKNGTLDEKYVDEIALRMIKFAFECKANETKTGESHFDEHHALVRKVAANGAVLLKNEGGLPLKTSDSIAVIGALAEHPRYQGAGSSHINPPKTVSFLEALDAEKVEYEYAPGYSLKGDGYEKNLIEEAIEVAKTHDQVLIFMGLTDEYESEGYDRTHLGIPTSHEVLVNEVYKVNKNISVILSCGSPIEMSAWVDKPKAILNLYLGGQAVGEAAFDVIFGKVNPSGKLAESFPFVLDDCSATPYFPMGPRTVEYRESIYVGYRYYDTAKKDVRYPFGYGLSYTKFEYSDLKLSKKSMKDTDTLTVSYKVKNVGDVAGAEVSQVYVKDNESTIFRPEKELKGFNKTYLEPGEEVEVSVDLDGRAFAYYNVKINDWHVESGDFTILVGASSRDIRLEDTVTVESSKPEVEIPDYREVAPSYYSPENLMSAKDEEFVAIYGQELPDNSKYKKGDLDINCSLQQITVSGFGKFLYGLMRFGAQIVAIGAENKAMITETIKYMPLRSFSGFTGGVISPESVEGIVDICNGVKGGFRRMMKGFCKKKKKKEEKNETPKTDEKVEE